MSPSLNGNERAEPSHALKIQDPSQVGEARRFALKLCAGLSFEESRLGRVGIVINELANNLIRYAGGGEILCRRLLPEETPGLEILAVDRGPGFDPVVASEDGYSTGTTPGTGLGAIRRQSDVFDIFSQKGRGTVIVSRIFASDLLQRQLPRLEIGAVNLPIKGETECGDAWAIRIKDEKLSVLVADGLGHGPLARQAAIHAVEAFDKNTDAALGQRLSIIHARLKSTRGAAVFLADWQANGVEFIGVGNIRSVIMSGESIKTLLSQNGTAGLQLRTPRALHQAWDAQGYLIFHSDGLQTRWDFSPYPGLQTRHPSVVAAVIHRDFSRGTDDATIVAVRRRP